MRQTTSKENYPIPIWKKDPDFDPYVPGLISIIAPCYNESGNIDQFMRAVAELELQPYQCEVNLVNDRSRDGSGMILEVLKSDYPDLQVIHFSRNFGQQQALMAGIRAARGEVMVTIDLDLQQPPDHIPAMIKMYQKGFDVVHAIPEYQSDSASGLKKLTSKLYYNLIRRLVSSSGVVYKSNDFRLISHRVAAVLRGMPERNLYLRGIIADLCPVMTYSTQDLRNPGLWVATTTSYQHRPRVGGETKYTWIKMIRLALDGMTATSISPLRYGIVLGLLSIVAAFCLSIWALYVHLVAGDTVPGWTSLMIVLLFFSSIQFLLIGLLGEYIGKIFLQVRGRPGYIVEEYAHLSDDHPRIPEDEEKSKPMNRSQENPDHEQDGESPGSESQN